MSASAAAPIQHKRGAGFDLLFKRDRKKDDSERRLPGLPKDITDKIFAMAGGSRYSEGVYQQWAVDSYNALFGREIHRSEDGQRMLNLSGFLRGQPILGSPDFYLNNAKTFTESVRNFIFTSTDPELKARFDRFIEEDGEVLSPGAIAGLMKEYAAYFISCDHDTTFSNFEQCDEMNWLLTKYFVSHPELIDQALAKGTFNRLMGTLPKDPEIISQFVKLCETRLANPDVVKGISFAIYASIDPDSSHPELLKAMLALIDRHPELLQNEEIRESVKMAIGFSAYLNLPDQMKQALAFADRHNLFSLPQFKQTLVTSLSTAVLDHSSSQGMQYNKMGAVLSHLIGFLRSRPALQQDADMRHAVRQAIEVARSPYLLAQLSSLQH